VPLWLKNDDEPDENGQQLTDHNDNDTDLEYLGDCVDIKNEVLIKHMGPMTNGHQYPKLKSNSLEHETKGNGNALNGKASTMLADNESPIWDRGAADGVSNQPDSDFGK
jgi:nostrin